MTYLTSPTSLHGISQSSHKAEVRSTADISQHDNQLRYKKTKFISLRQILLHNLRTVKDITPFQWYRISLTQYTT